jgi:PST family polysaccharide transporter
MKLYKNQLMMRNEVAKGGFIFFGKNISVLILGVILTSLLARFLHPENFGILSIATSFSFFLVAVFNFGLESTAIKMIAEFRAKGQHKKVSRLLKNIIKMRLFFASLASLSFFLLSDFITGFYNIESLSSLLKLSSLLFFSVSNSRLLFNSLNGFKLYSESSKAEIINKFFSILFSLLFFSLGYLEPGSAIMAFIISSFLAGFYSFRRLSPFIIKERESNMYRATLCFALPLCLSGLLMELQWGFANIVLGAFDIPSNVGILSLALKIAGALLLLNESLSPTFLPLFSELRARGVWKREVYSKVSSYTLLFAVISTGILLFFTREFMLILGGQEYLPSVQLVQFLSLIPLFSVFSTVNYNFFISFGKTKTIFYLALLRITLILSLLLLLTPLFMGWGASLALFISSFLATFVSTFIAVRMLGGGFVLSRHARSLLPLTLAVPALFIPGLTLRLILFSLFLFLYSNISLRDDDIRFLCSIMTGNSLFDKAISLLVSVAKRIRVIGL